MSSVSVYTAKFYCSNCDHDWSEEIPKKHSTEEESNIGVTVNDLSTGYRKFSRLILCKGCELSRYVKKLSRRPVS